MERDDYAGPPLNQLDAVAPRIPKHNQIVARARGGALLDILRPLRDEIFRLGVRIGAVNSYMKLKMVIDPIGQGGHVGQSSELEHHPPVGVRQEGPALLVIPPRRT